MMEEQVTPTYYQSRRAFNTRQNQGFKRKMKDKQYLRLIKNNNKRDGEQIQKDKQRLKSMIDVDNMLSGKSKKKSQPNENWVKQLRLNVTEEERQIVIKEFRDNLTQRVHIHEHRTQQMDGLEDKVRKQGIAELKEELQLGKQNRGENDLVQPLQRQEQLQKPQEYPLQHSERESREPQEYPLQHHSERESREPKEYPLQQHSERESREPQEYPLQHHSERESRESLAESKIGRALQKLAGCELKHDTDAKLALDVVLLLLQYFKEYSQIHCHPDVHEAIKNITTNMDIIKILMRRAGIYSTQ